MPGDRRGDDASEGDARTEPVEQTGSTSALVRRFRVTCIEGPDAGASLESDGDRVVIGTSRAADFVLADPAVSRFHCELIVTASRILIRDLGSHNGTCINGAWVKEAYAAEGFTMRIGRSAIQCAGAEGNAEIPISQRESFGDLVGRSIAMRRVFSFLERAAELDATVLIQGETGTGKDVAAESMHHASRRRDGPFVVVDCGALPAGLLESELFGHERGAFTGADRARAGAFQAASGGTLFLDEIGELPLDLQPKLLRVLEHREVRSVGSVSRTAVDVRVIAATNRHLQSEVNAQRFRADLYYRLAVMVVSLPALRDHPDDLPMLVDSILNSLGVSDTPVAEEFRDRRFRMQLATHPWPGNVRELRNYIERSVAMSQALPLVATKDAASAPVIDPTKPLRRARAEWVSYFERRYLESLLANHDGNITAAAKAAGVARVHLYRLLARGGLR